jgi:tetratricopeptide (TPR) repeat protein
VPADLHAEGWIAMSVQSRRTKVFISYSHQDEKWLNRLTTHLKPIERDLNIEVWHDKKLAPGSRWREEIASALETARVAILLVSADFLASEFIKESELPSLLRVSEGITILPVIVSASRYARTPHLEGFQSVNAVDAPLIGLPESEQEEVLARVSEAVEAAFSAPFGARRESGSLSRLAVGQSDARHLRAPVSDFVGRGQELHRIAAWFSKSADDSGVAGVVIRGMGGLGKTELANKVAALLRAQFPGGQLLIELRGETDAPLSAEQALRSLVQSPSTSGKSEPDELERIKAKYRDLLASQVLILADNAQGAEQLRLLVPPVGLGSALLVTTRRRFTIPGMAAIDLDTFPPEAAEQLLLQICPRIGESSARLAKLCDYLPLALRVSASMLASDDSLRVERYLERLQDERQRLNLLRDFEDASLDVKSSLGLSYDALDVVAQDVLDQLTAFPAGFDLAAAAGIALPQSDADSEAVLSLLRRRSLVEWHEDEQRYRLHDLVRVFAAGRALSRDPTSLDPARRRHARYYVELLSQAKQRMDAAESDTETSSDDDAFSAFYDMCEIEATNLIAGWRWAREHAGDIDADDLLRRFVIWDFALDAGVEPELFIASIASFRRDGRHDEAMELLEEVGGFHVVLSPKLALGFFEQARQIAGERQDLEREAALLVRIGTAHGRAKEPAREVESYERAIDFSTRAKAPLVTGSALVNLGNVRAGIEDRVLYRSRDNATSITTDSAPTAPAAEEALKCYASALAIWRTEEHSEAEAATAFYQAMANYSRDENKAALDGYELAYAAMRRANRDIPQRERLVWSLVATLYGAGRADEAVEYAKELIEPADHRTSIYCWQALYFLAVARQGNDLDSALEYATQALEAARVLENRPAEATSLMTLGDLAIAANSADKAIEHYERALTILKELEDRERAFEVTCLLAATHADAGRNDAAAEFYQEALKIDDTSSAYRAYRGLGFAYWERERYEEARTVFVRLSGIVPSDFWPYYCIGGTYADEDSCEEALAAYVKAAALTAATTDSDAVFEALGNAYFYVGRYDEAIDAYRKATNLHPSKGIFVARIYSALGRRADARHEYEQVYATDPSKVEAQLGLTRLAKDEGDYATSGKWLEIARPLVPNDDHVLQASFAALDSRPGEAIDHLETALSAGDVARAFLRRAPEFDVLRSELRFQVLVGEIERRVDDTLGGL